MEAELPLVLLISNGRGLLPSEKFTKKKSAKKSIPTQEPYYLHKDVGQYEHGPG
jgi:hypothetical protein